MLIDHNQYVFHIWCNVQNKKLHPLFKSELIDFIQNCRGDDIFNWMNKSLMVKNLAYHQLADDIDQKLRELVKPTSNIQDGIHKVLIFTDVYLKFKRLCNHTCETFMERRFQFLKEKNISVKIWSLQQNQFTFTEDIHFPLDSWQNLGEILKGEYGERKS